MTKVYHVGEVISGYLLHSNAPLALAYRKHMAEKASKVNLINKKGGNKNDKTFRTTFGALDVRGGKEG